MPRSSHLDREESGIATIPFTEARRGFSGLFDQVAGMHHPVIVARQGDDDEVVMLSRTETLEALDRFRFDPRLKSDEGELIISVPEIEIDGVGSTFEAALADASKQIEDYAIRYFERIPFYKQTHRAPHFPYLLRFMLTPKEARSTLLLSDSEASLGPELVRA